MLSVRRILNSAYSIEENISLRRDLFRAGYDKASVKKNLIYSDAHADVINRLKDKLGSTETFENAINQLIWTYAPEVRFHSQEEYFPASVDWFLPSVELVYYENPDINKSGKLVVLHAGSIENGQKLIELLEGSEHERTVAEEKSNRNYYLNIVDEETRRGERIDDNGLSHAQCYAHIRTAPREDAVDIQYWFFYSHNPQNTATFGDHEGDWEHITVRLRDSALWPVVYFAKHQNEGAWNTSYTVDTHPIVYSAKDSHASYRKSGKHSRGDTGIWDLVTEGLFGISKDELIPDDLTDEKGYKWQCWNNVVDVGSKQRPLNGCDWLKYSGSWGGSLEDNISFIGLGFGGSPSGPAFKNAWDDDGDRDEPAQSSG